VQHACEVLHDWPVCLQSGSSQEHASPGAPVHANERPVFGSLPTHCRPLQQFASDVHACATSEQVAGGGPHAPSLQVSVALQHGNVAEHAPPVFAQVGGGSSTEGAVQMPSFAEPYAFLHVSGEQQSPSTVQVPPVGTHALGVCDAQWPVGSQNAEQHSVPLVHEVPSGTQPPHTWPSKQYPVQHWVPEVQAAPAARHVPPGDATRHICAVPLGTRFTWKQVSPSQQLPCVPLVPVQVAPRGVQLPPGPGGFVCAQRRTPAPSGTHGTPLQHWSLNWQTWPAWMQQPGRFAS
jgi:hypothetical protein